MTEREARAIDQWWPALHEEVRRVLVNRTSWSVNDSILGEIERVGGPPRDHSWWDRTRDDGVALPIEAQRWVRSHPDHEALIRSVEPDPRAAWFQRGWPHRQD